MHFLHKRAAPPCKKMSEFFGHLLVRVFGGVWGQGSNVALSAVPAGGQREDLFGISVDKEWLFCQHHSVRGTEET